MPNPFHKLLYQPYPISIRSIPTGHKKKLTNLRLTAFFVPPGGIEPPLQRNWILNPARLPVPPQGQFGTFQLPFLARKLFIAAQIYPNFPISATNNFSLIKILESDSILPLKVLLYNQLLSILTIAPLSFFLLAPKYCF